MEHPWWIMSPSLTNLGTASLPPIKPPQAQQSTEQSRSISLLFSWWKLCLLVAAHPPKKWNLIFPHSTQSLLLFERGKHQLQSYIKAVEITFIFQFLPILPITAIFQIPLQGVYQSSSNSIQFHVAFPHHQPPSGRPPLRFARTAPCGWCCRCCRGPGSGRPSASAALPVDLATRGCHGDATGMAWDDLVTWTHPKTVEASWRSQMIERWLKDDEHEMGCSPMNFNLNKVDVRL